MEQIFEGNTICMVALAAVTAATVLLKAASKNHKKNVHRKGPPRTPGSRRGKSARPRTRKSVVDIYNALGPIYFRRAYRMTYESFLELHDELKDGISNAVMKKRRRARRSTTNRDVRHQSPRSHPPIPNGKPIETSVRLACALRYFAGGSPYDIMVKYGISHTEAIESAWFVVEALNRHRKFFIQYPSDHEEQHRMAAAWKAKSGVGFDNCAGAIDGLLVWIHQPTEIDAQKSGLGRKKFFCARKNKVGINCQAVCDCRGKILDISMKYGGSSSDCLAFEASELWSLLEDGLLAPGLVLFGDNAYLNTNYLATPYPGISSGSKDDYNFYHSQVNGQCLSSSFRMSLLMSHFPPSLPLLEAPDPN